MSDTYKYIDPDYSYTDPETGLLRNLQDITDPDVLFAFTGCYQPKLSSK